MYRNYLKRPIDFILSLCGLLILSPVFFLIICLIRMESRGPVLFRQKRLRKGKKHFYIYKFRTMKVDTPKEVPTHLLDNPDLYITKIGKILRKTSLDELPQLLNIIGGSMSIIGPRPALWNQYDLISERDKHKANDIRPGLTGWAQINGRDEIEIPIKAKLDGYYVDNISIWLDIKCFVGTIMAVIKKNGVIEGGTGSFKKDTGDKYP